MQPGMIPPELRALPQWVVWREIERDGKMTKPPFNPRTGAPARTHDQEGRSYPDRPQDTWADYETALKTCRARGWGGLGFVFTATDPFVGIDVDECVNHGRFNEQAREIVRKLDTYTEKSPSGAGLHLIARGTLPPGGRRKGSVEMYDSMRYFTMTGEIPNKCSCRIEDRQAELEELHHLIFGTASTYSTSARHLLATDDELLEKARSAKNGGMFIALYDHGITSLYDGDDSRADLALCGQLAFYTGGDADRIDRLFRASALYRPKWDRNDYRHRTIEKCLSGKTEFYSPNGGPRTSFVVVANTGEEQDVFRPTEVGSADRVLEKYGADLRHVYNENNWYAWNGNRWKARSEARALALVEKELRSLYDEARACTDDNRRKELGKYALRTESNRYMRSVLDIMRRREKIAAELADFDADRFALNCSNGTVDLRAGTIREHRKDDLITKLAGAPFVPDAPSPQWDTFLRRVMPDGEVRGFLQRACGYALTGDVSEQCFFFLHGEGCNGKSTFINTLLAVTGEYGLQAAPNVLISKHNESVPTDIAELQGYRFVSTVEVDEGRKLAEGLLKQMTGGDRMKARFMRQDFFEFDPTHKIFMAANHKPVITGTDYAIWRRVMLVPFTEKIGDNEKDPHLIEKLKDELSGILAWCVRGAMEWRENGLRPPQAVLTATEEYRNDQDVIGQFIAECRQGGSVEAGRLYEAYKAWCAASNEVAMTQNNFGRELTNRGYPLADKRKRPVMRLGISLHGESLDI